MNDERVDRVPADGLERRARGFAAMVSALGIALGVVSFIAALDVPFAASKGARVLQSHFLAGGELLWLNRLGALMMAGLAATGLVGALLRHRGLLLGAGLGLGAAGVLSLIQAGRSTSWLGGRGNTFAVFLAGGLALFLAARVATSSGAEEVSSDTPRP